MDVTFPADLAVAKASRLSMCHCLHMSGSCRDAGGLFPGAVVVEPHETLPRLHQATPQHCVSKEREGKTRNK